jgi:Bax protein
MSGTLKSASPWMLPLGVAGILVALLLWLFFPCIVCRSLPDFAGIDDVDTRKAAFFAHLDPYIEQVNREMLRQRKRLDQVGQRMATGRLGRRDDRWIRRLAEEHGLPLGQDEETSPGLIEQLRLRIDIIPESMALAQAALESGWGTSRFAQQGNNLFGIWCYEPGCGIVPKHRPAGADYEVRRFRSPRDAFRAYSLNLNSNPAYESLWLMRRDLREQGQVISGLVLADGLYRYSQEQWAYVEKVKSVIRSNGLQQLDVDPF